MVEFVRIQLQVCKNEIMTSADTETIGFELCLLALRGHCYLFLHI